MILRIPASRALRVVALISVAGVSVAAVIGTAACITVPEFRSLEREVAEMREAGAQGGVAPGDTRLADLGAEVTSLQREVERLRGAVEEAQHAAEDARRVAEEARVAGQSRPGSIPGAASEAGAASQGLDPALSSLSQEVRDYERGSALYRQGRYSDAIDHLRAFLQNYPSSDYADNALFWVGECQFKLGDYERAVLTFEDVVKKYPSANKVPDALYRQGVALLAMGERDGDLEAYRPAAREIFERILREYPDSERVREAQTQLEKLRL